MSDASTNLVLPFVQEGQAQKHVTVNEALRRLDAVVQLAVVSATTSAQPGAPADGSVYLLPSGKTGAYWAAMGDGALAYYADGVWEQISPREGWLAFVKDTDKWLFHTGSVWRNAPGQSITINLADDAATSFTPPSQTGLLLLEDFQAGGVFFFRCDGTTGATIIAADSRYAVANGVLAGTTGADGKITIAGHSDGKIYIENRIGGSRPITYTVLDR